MLTLDVDAICKLANWRLLDELSNIMHIKPESMMTLGSLIHRAKRSIDKLDTRLFVATDAASNLAEFLRHTSPLPEADPKLLAIFQDVADIDVGEAILFSILIQHPESRFVTGDKRALRALTNVPQGIREALAGRVICLEQVVAKTLAVYGLERLRKHICPHKDIDRSVANAMGSRCDAGQASVEEGLYSYIEEIRKLYDPSVLADWPA
ncbi:MAG: hypothetical protein EPO06_08645 [Burkholderiaceae bacterium]|nr:MAG: hypothetical protein EPO06_08645 [Burkholderiaceae bacterium]